MPIQVFTKSSIFIIFMREYEKVKKYGFIHYFYKPICRFSATSLQRDGKSLAGNGR